MMKPRKNDEKPKLHMFRIVNALYSANVETNENDCSSFNVGYEWDELSMFETVPCLSDDCGV